MTSWDIKGTAHKAERYVFAALRIVAGLMLAFHGAQKLLGWYAGTFTPAAGSQLWFAGVIELFGGVLVAVGLLTRPAAFLISGEMAVAYVQAHWRLQTGGGMWIPTINKGELAALYSFVFLFIAAHGAGAFSLHALFERNRPPQRAPEPAYRGA